MGSIDADRIEHGYDIGDPQGHDVGIVVVWLVAPTVTEVIDEYESEAGGTLMKSHRHGRIPNELDRIQEAAEDDDRLAVAAVVLEVDPPARGRIDCIGHGSAPLECPGPVWSGNQAKLGAGPSSVSTALDRAPWRASEPRFRFVIRARARSQET